MRNGDRESVNEIRKAGVGPAEAFRRVWATGTPDQREKAPTVVNVARRKLYLILADEDREGGGRNRRASGSGASRSGPARSGDHRHHGGGAGGNPAAPALTWTVVVSRR